MAQGHRNLQADRRLWIPTHKPFQKTYVTQKVAILPLGFISTCYADTATESTKNRLFRASHCPVRLVFDKFLRLIILPLIGQIRLKTCFYLHSNFCGRLREKYVYYLRLPKRYCTCFSLNTNNHLCRPNFGNVPFLGHRQWGDKKRILWANYQYD